MSEHYAYSQIGSINAGWSDQIYTLTVSLLGQYMCSIFLLLYIWLILVLPDTHPYTFIYYNIMYIYYTQAQHMACKSVPVSLIVLSFVIYSNQSP